MHPLRVSQDVLTDFDSASRLEWLETNGLGGFASGTATGAHSRQYHGLTFFAMQPPAQRVLFLSRFEETLLIGDDRHDLSANRFVDAVAPEGYRALTSFTIDPFPVWTWDIDGVVIEKSLFMTHGKNELTVFYRVLANPGKKLLGLELRPLLAYRPIHRMQKAHEWERPVATPAPGKIRCAPDPQLPTLALSHNALAFDESRASWYRDFLYQEERERGYDAQEDLYCIGTLTFEFGARKPAFVTATTDVKAKRTIETAKQTEKNERARRAKLVRKGDGPFVRRLKLAADQFVVQRGRKGKSIVAGYHWFTDYGRDSMISIPGLLLARGLHDDAKAMVKTYLAHMEDGLIPNRFSDIDGKAEYNTVDATLWLFETVRLIAERTDDTRFVKSIFSALVSTIECHERGTRFGVHVDPSDGLLSEGEKGFALTWMDAVVGDFVVTPRFGKPVEINALWYCALKNMHGFAKMAGAREKAEEYAEKAERVRESFRAVFWNEETRCLFDCIDLDGKGDAQMRPNQIFAVSLSDDLLAKKQQRAVLDAVTAALLTPVGLRSLSPDDPEYKPVYEGGHLERDIAYHQGTAWGWLIGPYVTAYLRVHGRTAEARKTARVLLSAFESHFLDAGLGQLSEIFDADPPHRPRGCIAQAWTVAEVLRVMEELR